MSRIFIIIFCLATSFTLYTACTSGQEKGIDTNNDDFILQCDTLLGTYPDIVVKNWIVQLLFPVLMKNVILCYY